MLFRRSRSASVQAPAQDRWHPLAELCRELGQAVALQDTAERVIQGCAGGWPVDGCWSAEGAPVVTELLRISSRIGDITVLEQDSELKEDACYLVLWHQAALDRALRLAYTADADAASEQERTSLTGLGEPAAQLRRLHDETLALLRAAKPAPAPGAAGVVTSSSAPRAAAVSRPV
ncbi:hypothetical protein CLV35_3328 [Motilibacter peucedani]|uniref:Uncharacterized protein n=1 Tax=Motilibacter peucedani TaxID=598650 RepID=A0A420XMF4_9ACTN|nr:hypothetical protein [Motilibacter peucedani]RKS71528.1 hypothetical protein CLV35_3328 [Motilibacter peucedani]